MKFEIKLKLSLPNNRIAISFTESEMRNALKIAPKGRGSPEKTGGAVGLCLCCSVSPPNS